MNYILNFVEFPFSFFFCSGIIMAMTWPRHSEQNLISYHPCGFKYSTSVIISMKSVEHTMLMRDGFKMYGERGQGKKVNDFSDIWFFVSIFFYLTKMNFLAVLPRVMFEQFSEADYSHVLRFENAHIRDEIAELLVQVCKDPKHKFDGIVLEVWFQLAGRVQDKHLLRLVEHLGERFLALVPISQYS